MKAPLFSIIIPAHNEEKHIREALESIERQKFKSCEIIIVADNCIDHTVEIVKDYQKYFTSMDIKIIETRKGSAAGARNLGASYATGKYLIFHDADCVQDKRLLHNLAHRVLTDWDIHGVATKTKNMPPKSWLQRGVEVQRKQRWEYNADKVIPLSKDSGINVAIIRRDIFNVMEGYDEDIFYYEDGEFSDRFFRAGCKAVFDPDVIQYHYDPLTLKESFGQCRNIAKGLRMRIRRGDKLTFWEWVSLVSGIVTPINLLSFLAIVGTGYNKTNDFAGSVYLGILWELRSLAKLYYFLTVRI